jgi:teichuronic acid biosynthesis glycosyltransferase TuaG
MQNNNPLVSIIVTTHNRADLLLETVNSILQQTYVDFELLIIDDNSTDHTSKVISLINDNRIKYYCLDECSGGPAVPRNIGIKNSRGIYIAFCDDDDIWKINKLEIQIRFLIDNNLDLVSSNMDCFENNILNIIFSSKNRKIFNIYDLILTNQINTSSVLLKKSIHSHFNESKVFISVEDYLLWLNLYKKNYKFGFIKDSLVYYRVWHSNISSKNIKNLNLLKVRLKLFFSREHPDLFIILFCYISILINFSKYLVKKIIYK